MRQYVAGLKGAADLCDFMVGSGEATVSYIDQMVLGQLVAGLRDKEIKREIMEKAGIKGIKTSKLILRQVERLVRIKKQAK